MIAWVYDKSNFEYSLTKFCFSQSNLLKWKSFAFSSINPASLFGVCICCYCQSAQNAASVFFSGNNITDKVRQSTPLSIFPSFKKDSFIPWHHWHWAKPNCQAHGKGRARGGPGKVTQRSFMDGGWWMVDILSLMLYIKVGCHPPPATRPPPTTQTFNLT